MNARLRYLLITVNAIRPNYVVLIDEKLGIVKEVKNNTCVVETTLGETFEYPVENIKTKLVKFLAEMKDLRTIPIAHGDFKDLAMCFDTEERVEQFVKKRVFNIGGDITKIFTRVKTGDLVEIKDLKVVDKYQLMDKSSRIGTVVEVSNNKAEIKLNGGIKIGLKRHSYAIIGSEDFKQLFKVEFS